MCLGPFADLQLALVLMEPSFGTQLGPSHSHQGPAKAATNCGSLCSSKQVAQCQSQAESEIDLHWSSSQGAPRPTHSEANFRKYQSGIQLIPHPKKDGCRHQTLLKQILRHVVSTAQQHIYSDQGQFSQPDSLRVNSSYEQTNSN